MDRVAKIFVPNNETGQVPLVLSRLAFVIYFVFAFLMIISPVVIREGQLALLSSPGGFSSSEVINLVNASRSQAGLPPLKANEILSEVAREKAQDMLTKQYFAHTSPQNKTPWSFLRENNYVYVAAGENLAIDFPTAEEAHQSLLGSPSHRENILNKAYTEIGVAVVQGIFDNHPSILVVQFFGKPKTTAPATSVTSASEKSASSKSTAKSIKTTETKKAVPEAPSPSPKVIVEDTKPKIEIVSDPTPPKVMGAAEDESPKEEKLISRTGGVVERAYPYLRLISFLIMAFLLIGMTFMMSRTGAIPHMIAFNATILIAVLGYIAWTGEASAILPKISKEAFMAIESL